MIKASVIIWLLAAVAVIVVMMGYYLWTMENTLAVPELLTTTHGVVTGILHAEEKPTAVISGDIVYEGDTLHGIKVVKIYRDKVEFEKNKKRWTQHIREQPNRAWLEVHNP